MEQQSKGPGYLNFSELFDEIQGLVYGSWRFRWQAMAVAWVLCLSAWWFALSMPDVYRASGRLYIDTEDSLRPLLRGLAIQTDLLDEVNVMLQSILSRPTLEKIAIKSGFDLGNPDLVEEEAIVRRLESDIEMGLDRSQFLQISFNHSSPDVALAVVSVLIDEFVEGLVGSNRSGTQSAQEFLKKKLDEYEALLTESEARLADFKKRNIGQMPSERGGYYTRLQSEMRSLETLDSKIRLARQRRNDLERQMAGEAPVFGMMPSDQLGGGAASTPQIQELEAELTVLRLSYTDTHPDVIRVTDLLARLREELNTNQAGRGGSSVVSADMNPVYQQMKLQFSQADLELSLLVTERADQAALVEGLREKIDTIPEIEAELTRLDRSYQTYREQHSELLARLETARLSEDADGSAGMQFRVIDPPVVSSGPVAPDRKLLVTAGLVLSIIGGAGVAVLMSIFSPVIYSSRKLERLFGAPVLGTIRKVQTPTETTQIFVRLAFLSFALMGLVACYVAIMLFSRQSVQLANQLSALFG